MEVSVSSCWLWWEHLGLSPHGARGTRLAAKRFFRKALNAVHTQDPRVINVDKNAAYPKAIDELKEKEELQELVNYDRTNILII